MLFLKRCGSNRLFTMSCSNLFPSHYIFYLNFHQLNILIGLPIREMLVDFIIRTSSDSLTCHCLIPLSLLPHSHSSSGNSNTISSNLCCPPHRPCVICPSHILYFYTRLTLPISSCLGCAPRSPYAPLHFPNSRSLSSLARSLAPTASSTPPLPPIPLPWTHQLHLFPPLPLLSSFQSPRGEQRDITVD
jgi:hypothetical protein